MTRALLSPRYLDSLKAWTIKSDHPGVFKKKENASEMTSCAGSSRLGPDPSASAVGGSRAPPPRCPPGAPECGGPGPAVSWRLTSPSAGLGASSRARRVLRVSAPSGPCRLACRWLVSFTLPGAMAGRERRCSRAADPASAGTPASRRVCSALTDVARLQAAPAGLPADCEIEHSRGPPGLSAELAGCACEAVPGRSPQTRPAACGGVPVPARAGCVAVTQAV